MHIGCVGILCVVLGMVAYQDFRDRTVAVWVLGAVLLCCGALSLTQDSIKGLSERIAGEALLVAFLGGLLYLYFRLRGQDIRENIGLGDAAFIVAIMPLFSLVGLIAFALCTLVVALVAALKIRKIPLAGIQAVCLGAVLVANELFWKQMYNGSFWFADAIWRRLQNVTGAGI
jgi:hypothetical protein